MDSVHRSSLWTLIRKACGIPDKIINIVNAMYEEFECAMSDEGEWTGWIRIALGVTQDWVMRRTT